MWLYWIQTYIEDNDDKKLNVCVKSWWQNTEKNRNQKNHTVFLLNKIVFNDEWIKPVEIKGSLRNQKSST